MTGSLVIPPLQSEFVLTRQGSGPRPEVGRAGMIYRDLIPSHLGGRYLASHIAVPEGGPIPDWVHFHRIHFQIIFCRRGWARLVYEDQGPPFLMQAGDCVLQPPEIRHRVLESSAGFEVVEIVCPAEHETLPDPDMALPTGRTAPARDFAGQRFLHHQAAHAPWTQRGAFQRRDSGLGQVSGGLADVHVRRPGAADGFPPELNGGELLFGFMLEGSAVLEHHGLHRIGPADAFVIPPGEAWALSQCSVDAMILVAASPATPSARTG